MTRYRYLNFVLGSSQASVRGDGRPRPGKDQKGTSPRVSVRGEELVGLDAVARRVRHRGTCQTPSTTPENEKPRRRVRLTG